MQALAVDISLAGLLGENIYNFGELLLHPLVSLVAVQMASADWPRTRLQPAACCLTPPLSCDTFEMLSELACISFGRVCPPGSL